MSQRETATANDKLDPATIAAGTSTLAKHLQSLGVMFLPHPNSGAVNKWTAQMEQPEVDKAQVSSAGPSPAPRPVRSPSAPAPESKPRPKSAVAPTLLAEVEEVYGGKSLDADGRTAALQVLEQQVSACTRCGQLAQCRTNTVFGEGSVMPRVAFFGEGPGADEDRTGRPFVGKAGQLLTKMIEACKMRREDVYILNTVKCRPPGNRNPEPEEVSNCREYFERQLEILRPEYIVCLGAVASQSLLRSKLSVGRLRGTLHRYYESKVLVTYHPAYLLRNESAKKHAWQDLQLMLRDAGLM